MLILCLHYELLTAVVREWVHHQLIEKRDKAREEHPHELLVHAFFLDLLL